MERPETSTSHLPVRRRRGQHAAHGAPRRGGRRRAGPLPRAGGAIGERHGGRLFERIGDGAYACFTDADEAVAAADALQSAIVEHDWGVIGRMRVRIAMVTGDVEVRGDRYYGRPLFRAARLQALANGGETLLAGTTVDELGGGCPRARSSATSARSGCVTSRSPNGSSRWCILPARDPAERRHRSIREWAGDRTRD